MLRHPVRVKLPDFALSLYICVKTRQSESGIAPYNSILNSPINELILEKINCEKRYTTARVSRKKMGNEKLVSQFPMQAPPGARARPPDATVGMPEAGFRSISNFSICDSNTHGAADWCLCTIIFYHSRNPRLSSSNHLRASAGRTPHSSGSLRFEIPLFRAPRMHPPKTFW